ncbi:MAG: restriction endonuclease [Thermoleophilia bacterium]
MVRTRKQRERRAASIADTAYALTLLAFAYGWLRFHSFLAGFLMGFAVLGLTAGGLYLRRRQRDARLRDAGLGDLDHMNGEQFEELLQASFRDKGYRVSLTPNGADFGADLILERGGTKTVVQAKHWRTRKVGVRAVQEIAAAKAHYRADQAAVIASGDFTDQAVRLAASNGIELWDRARLARELLNEGSQTMDPLVSPTDPRPQKEPASTASPSCPRCGLPMVRRTGRHGPFWGCSMYPACRGTLAL